MGSKPPQTRKGTQGFPFQTLPHSAGNGREKGGAGAPEKNDKSEFVCEKSVNKRMLICVACGNGSFEYRIELSKTRRQRLC